MHWPFSRRADPVHAWGTITVAIGVAGVIAAELATLHANQPHFRWWWPTNWLVIPVVILLVGILLLVIPVRRSQEGGKSNLAGNLRPLEARYEPSPPYRRPSTQTSEYLTEHRVGIVNPAANPLGVGVRVLWTAVFPQPRVANEKWAPSIPRAVPRDQRGDPVIGIDLPPGRQELWVAISTWVGPDGVMAADEFAPEYGTSRGAWGGLPYKFAPGERLRFSYKISADNLPTAAFSLVLTASVASIQCELEG